jgi:hypothetical protein
MKKEIKNNWVERAVNSFISVKDDGYEYIAQEDIIPLKKWFEKLAIKNIEQAYKQGQEDEAVKHQKEDINVRKEMKEEISDAYKRGYNKRLEDEGKTGERWQHLYL